MARRLRFLFVALLLIVGQGSVLADTWTYELQRRDFTNPRGETKEINGVSWRTSYDRVDGTLGFDNQKGFQFNSGSDAYKFVSLKTSSILGTINKVTVNATCAADEGAKLTISVGGKIYGDSTELTYQPKNYTFEGNESGTLQILMTQSKERKALYLKSITIEYTPVVETLSDQASENTLTAGLVNVNLTRSFNASAWNSLVLPFDLNDEQITAAFGSDVKVAAYKSATKNDNGTYTLNFTTLSTRAITANKPVFIYGANDLKDYTFSGVSVKAGTPTQEAGDFDFVGTYNKIGLTAGDWFVSSDNKFYRANGQEKLKPTRAVFRAKEAVGAKSLSVKMDGNATAIVGIEADGSFVTGRMFNLNGQQVGNDYRGIVIVNGKKYLKQ